MAEKKKQGGMTEEQIKQREALKMLVGEQVSDEDVVIEKGIKDDRFNLKGEYAIDPTHKDFKKSDRPAGKGNKK